MENWQLALVVIAALLVGTLIPAIVQYRNTMRSWEKLVRDNEADVRRTMRELTQLSTRLNGVGGVLATNTQHIESFFESFHGITEGVRKLSSTVRTASVVGAAVAPAVTAAIRALQSSAAHAQAAQAAQAQAQAEQAAEAEQLEREGEGDVEGDEHAANGVMTKTRGPHRLES